MRNIEVCKKCIYEEYCFHWTKVQDKEWLAGKATCVLHHKLIPLDKIPDRCHFLFEQMACSDDGITFTNKKTEFKD